MRCASCQHENPEGQPFCAECGRRLLGAPAGAREPAEALPQGSVLQDRYVITERLGQGGMGAV